jgi:hypothetical protein
MIEALLLAVSRSRMRVVIPGCDDTMEFRLKNHRWTLTDERVAEVESMISDGKTIPVLFDAHVRHAA